jgi:hypothetical protein
MAAALLGAAAAPQAEAAVISFAFPTPITTPVNGFVYWNMENQVAQTSPFPSAQFRLWNDVSSCGCGSLFTVLYASGQPSVLGGIRVTGPSNYPAALRLQNSSTVGAGATGFYGFGMLAYRTFFPSISSLPATTYGGGYFYPNRVGFIGLTWDFGGTQRFGWAKIGVDPGSLQGTLLAIGFDDNGDPIHISDVPEPASVVLLALGFAGLAAYRRRKKQAEPAIDQESC